MKREPERLEESPDGETFYFGPGLTAVAFPTGVAGQWRAQCLIGRGVMLYGTGGSRWTATGELLMNWTRLLMDFDDLKRRSVCP